MDGVRIEDIRGTVHVLQMKPDCGERVQRKESKCLGRGMLRLERAGRTNYTSCDMVRWDHRPLT